MDINPQGAPAEPQPAGAPQPKSGGNKTLVVIVAVVLGVAVLGWVGQMVMGRLVGFGMKKAIEAGTGVKIDDKTGSFSFKGKDGAQVSYNVNGDSGTITYRDVNGASGEIGGASGEQATSLPKSFPSDFPVMDGLKLESTFYVTADGRTTFTVSWGSPKSVEEVASYYKSAMTGAGWTQVSAMDYNGTQALSYSRNPQPDGSKDEVTLTVSTDNGETKVALLMSIKAAQ